MGYFDINGRANRREFALCSIANWVFISLTSNYLYNLITPNNLLRSSIAILTPFVFILVFQGPVTLRRLNDLAKRKQDILFLLVPFYNLYFLFILFVSPSSYIESPQNSPVPSPSEETLICPQCKSDNCAYDKAQNRVANILTKVFMTSKTDLDCRCFECGNQWTIK